MDAPSSGAAAPAIEHLFATEEFMQVLGLLVPQESPLHVDFKDLRVAACLRTLEGEIKGKVRDAAAAIKKYIEGAAPTRTSESFKGVNGTYISYSRVPCLG
jgi:hypothetical protein